MGSLPLEGCGIESAFHVPVARTRIVVDVDQNIVQKLPALDPRPSIESVEESGRRGHPCLNCVGETGDRLQLVDRTRSEFKDSVFNPHPWRMSLHLNAFVEVPTVMDDDARP